MSLYSHQQQAVDRIVKRGSFINYIKGAMPSAEFHWGWGGDYAVGYNSKLGPKLTVFQNHDLGYFRRSLFGDMALSAYTAIQLMTDNDQRGDLLEELWLRCERNRRNRHVPFWSDL